MIIESLSGDSHFFFETGLKKLFKLVLKVVSGWF
jgi:hypothetical protein